MGAQKNHLDETVLLSHPKQMFKMMDKKMLGISSTSPLESNGLEIGNRGV